MTDDFTGFVFDVERWFASVAQQRMSFGEKGVYLVMMFQQWRERSRSLPDDPEAVAQMIAVTDSQRAEVLAAWPAVRAKFVSDQRAPGRIFNAALERTRRKQRTFRQKKAEAGRRGGEMKARNRRHDDDLESSSAQHSSSSAQPKGEGVKESKGREVKQEITRAREVPRAHTGTVMDGQLPRDHVSHVFCDSRFSICVPAAVHAKFIGPLSNRFDGDRQQAHDALLAWYGRVAAALPDTFVMGDAFRFWQPRFDQEFASKDSNGSARYPTSATDVERVRQIVEGKA